MEIAKFEDVPLDSRLVFDGELVQVRIRTKNAIVCSWRGGNLYLYKEQFEQNLVKIAPANLQTENAKKL